MKRSAPGLLVLALVLALGVLPIPIPGQVGGGDEPAASGKANDRPTAPEPDPEPYDGYTSEEMSGLCVNLDTAEGPIIVEMYPEIAPGTVRNFINLAAIGAFDNTTFSRVVPGFIIQGGNLWTNEDATTAMKWRSRRNIADEPNQLKHDRGVISMARGDEPNSASTDFFILLREAKYLDGKFAAFGRVREGMELVEKINSMPVVDEKPENPVRIMAAKVTPCDEGMGASDESGGPDG